MNNLELSEREKTILRYVIHQFIITANPVGSRNISKKYDVGFSPATIRNVMADLEDSGLLGHPHTSAGRVPTDQGYRFYVDSLMGIPKLPITEKRAAESVINSSNNETSDLIKVTSTILSDITHQLACITYPQMSNSILEKIQIVKLSTSKILIVVTVVSGLVKTITLELRANYGQSDLANIQRILNQRLSGLKFSEIRETIVDRFKSISSTQFNPIIRVFLDSAEKIFTDSSDNKSVVTGAKNILTQPEFEELEQFQGIIELVEDRDIIVHVMKESISDDMKDVNIKIGSENSEERFISYSLVTKEYRVGDAVGSVGIIGPKRMEYSKVIATVEYVAELLTKNLN
ncbi:MAG: heat-inducible transcriptional repressor HrcA [Melioribacteraceae bacterium]|nr:heat-inducible transcriptional repressor HrcA [Melioribacteraceae bacterium]